MVVTHSKYCPASPEAVCFTAEWCIFLHLDRCTQLNMGAGMDICTQPMKRYSASLDIKEMQIQAILKYHLTPISMAVNNNKEQKESVGKHVEKLHLLCPTDWHIKCCMLYRKQHEVSPKICNPDINFMSSHNSKSIQTAT